MMAAKLRAAERERDGAVSTLARAQHAAAITVENAADDLRAAEAREHEDHEHLRRAEAERDSLRVLAGEVLALIRSIEDGEGITVNAQCMERLRAAVEVKP